MRLHRRPGHPRPDRDGPGRRLRPAAPTSCAELIERAITRQGRGRVRRPQGNRPARDPQLRPHPGPRDRTRRALLLAPRRRRLRRHDVRRRAGPQRRAGSATPTPTGTAASSKACGLPITYRRDRWQALLDGMRRDKKSRGDLLRFVVLDGVGRARHPRRPGHRPCCSPPTRRSPPDALRPGRHQRVAGRGFPRDQDQPGQSLMPQIVNEDACAEALAASTDPGDLILVPARRRARRPTPPNSSPRPATTTPSSLRLRIFEADVLRVSNRLDRAVDLFRQLLAETHGTPDGGGRPPAPRPVLLRQRQHRAPPSNPSPRRWTCASPGPRTRP